MEASKRSDKSILYRGRQLSEAEALQLAQPDLMSGESIVAFLAASAIRQVRRFRVIAALPVIATVVIGALAFRTENARRVALARERSAQSLRLIAESRNRAGLHSLMFALEADRILPSDRTLSNLVARLEHYWYVERAWWETRGKWHPLVVSPDGAFVVTAD